MADHVYKLVELVGTSSTSVEDAINQAIKQASASLKNLRWFEVGQIRGEITEGKVGHWQVSLKLGFTIESEAKP